MTKKQYKVGYFEDPNPVDDYVETIDGEYLDASDVVRLLNKLSEENRKLKRENEQLKEVFHLFSFLAEDYHLTFEQLFEITREAIEKR